MPTATAPTRLRRLSPLESVFWTMDQVTRMTVCGIAELAGELPLRRLTQALAALQRRHPLLGARIVEGERRWGRTIPFFTTDGVGDVPVQLLEVPDRAALRLEHPALQARVEREVNTRLDGAGPLWRLTVLHTPRRQDGLRSDDGLAAATLLASVHHSVADGLSVVTVLRELVALLNGEPPGPTLPLRPGPDDRLPERSLGHAWGILARQTAARRRFAKRAGKLLRLRTPESVPFSTRQAALRFAFLDRGDTDRLRAATRAEGVTVHAALCTAVAVAVGRLESAGPMPHLLIGSPVDLRRRLGWQPDEIASNSFLATTSLVAPSLEAFWPAARRFDGELRSFFEGGFLFGHTPAMSRLGAALRTVFPAGEVGASQFATWAQRLQSCTTGVSNLGAVDLGPAPGPQPGPGDPPLAIARFVAAASFANIAPFGLAAGSSHGELSLCFPHMLPLVSSARAAALVDETLAALSHATE